MNLRSLGVYRILILSHHMSTDCPILVWMLSLNREYTEEEYDACFDLVKECVHYATFQHNPPDPDSFRESTSHRHDPLLNNCPSLGQLMTHMLPLLMMRHRRIPRAKWRDCMTSNGKHWIEQVRNHYCYRVMHLFNKQRLGRLLTICHQRNSYIR